jgi:hypothetical protein
MILFTLRCGAEHEFEGWFRDGASYEKQEAAGEIACPHCGDSKVEKAPMAPRVVKSSERPAAPAPSPAQIRAALMEMRRQVEKNCAYVGPRFAEEARKIHYGEAEAKGIYGESTPQEAKDLADEGIGFGRIPWVPLEDA